MTSILAALGLGIVAGVIYLLFQNHAAEVAYRHSADSIMLSIIQKKDERIAAMDADYKALVESYLRETGKVYVRPVMTAGETLRPAEPNPFRFKPPPPWAPRVASSKAGK